MNMARSGLRSLVSRHRLDGNSLREKDGTVDPISLTNNLNTLITPFEMTAIVAHISLMKYGNLERIMDLKIYTKKLSVSLYPKKNN